MSSESDSVTASKSDIDVNALYCGRVKWFNNKAGYGFCTIKGGCDDDRVDEDIFVHHSGVKVDSEQYKYLVQGEYVHFNLMKSDSKSHPYQASNLTGMFGGKLMCETRNEQRQQRADHDSSETKPRRRGHRKQTQSRNTDSDNQWSLSESN